MLRGRFLRTSTFRLTLSYVAVFGVSVLAMLAFIYWSTSQSIRRQVDDAVTAEVDALTQHFRLEGPQALADILNRRSQSRSLNGALYLLAGPDGAVIAGNVAAWPVEPAENGRWLLVPLGGEETAVGRAQSTTLDGGYRLLVGRDLRVLDHFQTVMIEAMAWALLAMLVVGGGGGYVLSRWALMRIDGIRRGAERIMRGDMAHRMDRSGSGDEYDRLVDTLNAMLDRIALLMDGVRTVANDVAHDLRSPLTRMRADLEEAVLRGRDEAELRRTCERVMADADDLLVTFNALLSIAEAEAGVGLASPVAVDLAPLIDDAIDLYGPLAEDAGLTLVIDLAPADLVVLGSRELLFRVLSNLIDNAIKYAPAGGIITVGAGPADDRSTVDLWVADTGPGIPEADRERVLGRFVRLDLSRTTPGNGLGLALVAAIARMHRAPLSLEDAAAGQGLRVRLRLPRVAAA